MANTFGAFVKIKQNLVGWRDECQSTQVSLFLDSLRNHLPRLMALPPFLLRFS